MKNSPHFILPNHGTKSKPTPGEQRFDLTKHLTFLFDFAYYLGCSPFKFIRENKVDYRFVREVWKPQQVMCATLHFLCVVFLISKIREKLPNSTSTLKNPTPYFELVLSFCHFFYKVVIIKRFWCNGNEFLKVLNTVLNENDIPVKRVWVTQSRFLYSLYGFFFLKIIASLVSGFTFVVPINLWTPSWWLRRLVAQSRFVFRFWAISVPIEAPELVDITSVDVICAILMFITYFSRYVLAEVCDLIVFAFALTLWIPANFFAIDVNERLNDNKENYKGYNLNRKNELITPNSICNEGIITVQELGSSHWSHIYRHFQAIENLSEVINTALGTMITWYLAEGIMYYSIHLNTVLIASDVFKRLVQFCFFAITFCNLYISADICIKMEAAKSWLGTKNNSKTVPTDEAYLVLHEIIVKDIGLRGNNTFTITFPFVAGYVSLIVTFFIICVQESDLIKE